MATQRVERNEKLILAATVLSATVAAVNLYIAWGKYKDFRDAEREDVRTDDGPNANAM